MDKSGYTHPFFRQSAPPRTIRKWLRRLAFWILRTRAQDPCNCCCRPGVGLRPAADHPQMVTTPGVLDPADPGARSLQLLLQTWCGSAPRRGPSANGYDAWRFGSESDFCGRNGRWKGLIFRHNRVLVQNQGTVLKKSSHRGVHPGRFPSREGENERRPISCAHSSWIKRSTLLCRKMTWVHPVVSFPLIFLYYLQPLIPHKRFDIFPPDWGMLRRMSRRVQIFLYIITRQAFFNTVINVPN